MKRIILIVFLTFFKVALYSQDCKDFKEGIFENDTEYGQFIMERKGNFQLEKSTKYGIIYLNKIEKINDCEYIIKRYKVISNGILPKPNMEDTIKTTIYRVKYKTFYYRFNSIGTNIPIEGKFIKISDSISNEFKIILAGEKNNMYGE
ncbi:hypothetical protein ABH942_002473 [Flavobacterium sp. 28YEA47A]|uniref:hypothetical protein n=1 Tax=Flavobacterium sp. 28YEA47A TaxID=3156276 RepID=UPI003512A446